MKLAQIINFLESIAPLNYQENYDNAGLITGTDRHEITSALVSLDCTEAVVDEAVAKGCNLIISHHPIVFKGLKKLNGKSYVERVLLKAIKNDISLYAIHTNLDNISKGVNAEICKRLGILKPCILAPKNDLLKKLVTFCPTTKAAEVREALFSSGCGHIGLYSNCSFNVNGFGSFKAGEQTKPYVGEIGLEHHEPETRIETVFKAHKERIVINALLKAHPYQEAAYDIYPLNNADDQVGSGMVGFLEQPKTETEFLTLLKNKMQAKVIRHTALLGKPVKKVAVCGGSGSFLLKNAIAAEADVFITADFKYHDFFDAENKIIIADIGHYETEQFTSNLLVDNIQEKFPTFAVCLAQQNTNPINYFI